MLTWLLRIRTVYETQPHEHGLKKGDVIKLVRMPGRGDVFDKYVVLKVLDPHRAELRRKGWRK